MNFINECTMGVRVRITGVTSARATRMGNTKPLGPCWRCIPLFPIVLILGDAPMDPVTSWLKRLWSKPTGAADSGKPHLTMLWTDFSEFPMSIPGKTNRIPAPKKVNSITHDQIETALWFGPPKLTSLKHYLGNTLVVKDNAQKVILWVYWSLTQWLVEQLSTSSQSHLLPLISTVSLNSDIYYSYDNNITFAQCCHVWGSNCIAIGSSMSSDACASMKMS